MQVSEQPFVREAMRPDMNAPAAFAVLENPRSHFAWTQRSGVKAIWIVLHYGPDARV